MVSPASVGRPVLDHVVITVRDGLDAAVEAYRRLGFSLTERGHHSLGSSNNLAIFGENYLELLGYEPGREQLRQDLWSYPIGLSGLVFKPSGGEDFTAPLRANGATLDEPKAFHRPVFYQGGSGEARFRTATVQDVRIQNGRIFFCQHQTPELVWMS
jgi:catechol 2,3-dioxygenase-like lactoylglutathione lyase family enzyme